MSHAAALSGKYKEVIYNDYNPLIVDLVRDAYNGKYNYSVFTPEFIDRATFEQRKTKDAYIKYIWSYGNRGHEYLYGKDVEPLKKAAHEFIINGTWAKELETISPALRRAVKSRGIKARRQEFSAWCRRNHKRFDFEHLQHIERLQHLERLERLERLITFTNISYQDYEYQDGDIVYCDPPYDGGVRKYDEPFDHEAFYVWAASRQYRIWFSCYPIYDDRFPLVWARRLTTGYGTGNNCKHFECLYTNRK